jgi:hypothetical protein
MNLRKLLTSCSGLDQLSTLNVCASMDDDFSGAVALERASAGAAFSLHASA